MRRVNPYFVLLALLLLAACGDMGGGDLPGARKEAIKTPESVHKEHDVVEKEPHTPDNVFSPGDPAVPQASGKFFPSLVALTGEDSLSVAQLNDVESCAPCHKEQVEEWRESAHALSAFANPFYRVTLDDFVEHRDPEKARFCNGCHDIAVTFEKPSVVDPKNRAGYAGVTCATCHSITEATIAGNASYLLDTSPIPLPRPNDEKSLQAHISRVGGPALRSENLCISCHEGFTSPDTGHAVIGQGVNELVPWRRSGYAGNKASRIDSPGEMQSCSSCHMPEIEEKKRRSHRFPGGHTALSASQGAGAQLEAHQKLLQGAASLDVMPMRAEGGRFLPLEGRVSTKPGDLVAFDVVMRNLRVGHNFPGGARDLRDVWLEVVLKDNRGEVLAQIGQKHRETGDDLDTYRLRVVMVDDHGQPVKEHSVAQFRTPVFDKTIGPRDASVARYTWEVPGDFDVSRLPLRVETKLLHRRLQAALHQKACDSSRSPRGALFRKNTRAFAGFDLDPCVPQPIIEIASRTVTLDKAPQSWKRSWEHGLALQHQVQERLEEARTTLEKAEEFLTDDAPVWARASVKLELGRVAAREGRTSEAEQLFEEALVLSPEHPAVFLARAEGYAQVWRWEKAARDYRRVTELAPGDDRGWRGLARSLGSLGRREESLKAARRGLALVPRDPHLLRSQSLAFSRVLPETPRAKLAQDTWLRFKRDEAASTIREKCGSEAFDCQGERVPISAKPLQAPGRREK